MIRPIVLLTAASMLGGCATVHPGESAVRFSAFKRGDSTKVVGPGTYRDGVFRKHTVYDMRWQTRMEELEVQTQDKLHMTIKASVTYRIRADALQELDRTLGKAAYTTAIKPVLLTSIRTEFAEFVHDTIVPEAASLQELIADRTRTALAEQGIEIARVVLDDIDYPAPIATAIERQMEAEQEIKNQLVELELSTRRSAVAEETALGAARVKLATAKAELEVAQKEAAVAAVRAQTQSDSTRALGEGLTARYLQLRAIEASEALAKSNNTKVFIIPEGKDGVPLMFHPDDQ